MQPEGGASVAAGAATAAQLQAVKDNAKALGLTWTIRPATITAVGDQVMAVFDGDTESIAMFPMMDSVPRVGQYVYVIMVPPAANYIVGPVAAPSDLAVHVDRSTSLAGILAETAVLTSLTYTFRAGTVWNWRVAGRFDGSVGTFGSSALRKNTVAGTVIASSAFFDLPVGITWHEASGFFKIGSTDVTCALCWTVAGGTALTNTASATTVPYLHAELAPPKVAAANYANAFLLT